MTFVVVYLVDPKRVELKNIGKNSNQNFLLFWAGTNSEPNVHKKPNFGARLAKEFFPSHIGVCYICRVKKFFGKFSIRIHLQHYTNIMNVYLQTNMNAPLITQGKFGQQLLLFITKTV